MANNQGIGHSSAKIDTHGKYYCSCGEVLEDGPAWVVHKANALRPGNLDVNCIKAVIEDWMGVMVVETDHHNGQLYQVIDRWTGRNLGARIGHTSFMTLVGATGWAEHFRHNSGVLTQVPA